MTPPVRFLLATAAFLLAHVGCGASTPVGGLATDGGADTSMQDGTAPETETSDADGGTADAADLPETDSDAGADAADVSADAAAVDAQSTNKNCTFNADCIASERCECTESAGCFCKVGARGTGKAGIDTCTDGNDCESALCLEGPKYQKSYYCSGPCSSAADCTKMLPVCSNIAFVGKICIRDPAAKP